VRNLFAWYYPKELVRSQLNALRLAKVDQQHQFGLGMLDLGGLASLWWVVSRASRLLLEKWLV